jgi:murein L,D-transpeptidase YafK
MPFFRPLVALLLLATMLLLGACSSFTGDRRHLVPLSGPNLAQLSAIGSSAGAPMMIRIFKQSSELEVWKQAYDGSYRLMKTYSICTWSGALGPKIAEGDRQAPEGFYTVTPGLMNPKSALYLSFNLGFPNKFDRVHGRTGSNLMVHGDCSSAGCYAITDNGIKEVYALARETFAAGNASFQVQVYPFRMTEANLAAQSASPHFAFWQNLKQGYDRFEATKRPPVWDVCEKKYMFDLPAGSGALDPAGTCPATPGTTVATMEALQ